MTIDYFKECFGKYIEATINTGETISGFVSVVESPYDSDDGHWWLDIEPHEGASLISVSDKEIKSFKAFTKEEWKRRNDAIK